MDAETAFRPTASTLGVRGEPVARLYEAAETLGAGGIWIHSARDELARGTTALAEAVLAAACGPHGPVASADAEFEAIGQQIGQNELGLHAAAGAALRVESDGSRCGWVSRPVILAVG